MKIIILIFIFTTFIFAAENPEILQKQIEKQLSINGDAKGATQKCLSELKNENLTKNQKQVFQKLLKRAAIQSKDLKIVSKAAAYLTSQKIECNKLIQRLSLGLPENLNTNLNKNIREALEYQWKNLNWQIGKADHDVFDEYLKELTENTNVTESARAQTAMLRTVICAWIDFSEIIELDFKTVEKQYKRLLIDLQCPKDNVKLIEVKKALDKYYETACEYMEKKHPYLAIASIINLSFYAKEISKEESLKDISKVQINRLFKQSDFFWRDYSNSKFEKQIPCIIVINMENSKYQIPYKLSLYFRIVDSNLIKLYSHPPKNLGWGGLEPKLKGKPVNINSLTNSMYYKYANILTDIISPNVKLEWKQGENKNVKVGEYNILVDRDWYYFLTTGKWNQIVWNERFSKLENDVLQLEKPLNEIRKYVYENYEKQRIKNKQKIVENQKEKAVFEKELKVFLEEGPKNNKTARKSRDNLLKILSKSSGFVKPELVDFINKYPELTKNSLIALWKTTKPKNYNQWWALKVYKDVQEFQEKIYSMQKPELIKQFLDSFLRETKTDLQQFLDNNHPAFRGTYYYIKGLANRNISMTNFVPLLATELKRISAGNSMLENYIYFIDDWIPLAFEAEKTELKYTLNTIINVNDYEFDWQAKARMKLAKNKISSYNKLPERERLRKTIETLVELNRGLREDSGLSTNTVAWVKKLGLDKPEIGDIYRLKKVYFPKRPLEFVSAAGSTINFRFKGMSKFKKEGEIISHAGKNLYKVGALISKTTNCFDKNINATKSKNISEVTLTDLQTGENFRLVIGEKSCIKTPAAILIQIPNNKEILIKKSGKVFLNEKIIAKVENINVENQTVTFVIGNKTNVLKIIQKKR